MQVQEIGTIIASITWFSGLLAVVFALAGYAVSCDPGKGKSYIPLAVVIGAVLVITGSALARIYLYAHMVIVIALIAAARTTCQDADALSRARRQGSSAHARGSP